ncbi:MAG: ABC transporter ATP-binding protein [Halobacteriota archaeon]
MDEVLVADDVAKRYGDTVALDGVSLSVGAGEVFGLIGPNGAGKTTLVRGLTGTVAVAGRVRVLGSPPGEVDPSRIGLLPQSFSPASRLTARELVAYYAGLYDHARDTDAVLASVGLEDAADTWYEHLSGGQQRRLCVGTALVNDPDVLFLDEPTTGIDPAGRRAVWDLVESLADGGATVFLTSHSMDEVQHLADRVGLLANGSLLAVGSPSSLVADHGGESRLVVHVDSSPDGAFDVTAVSSAVAESEFGDIDVAVEAKGSDLVFVGIDPTDIGEAVRTLESHGVTYDSLVWKEPDLEDVYLRLTGEAFDRAPSETTVAPAPAGGER